MNYTIYSMDCKHVMFKIRCYVELVEMKETSSKHNRWGVGVQINIQESGGRTALTACGVTCISTSSTFHKKKEKIIFVTAFFRNRNRFY